ncbi:hypothetical protein [Prosthecobacter sp.]|jgi:hypothetical protein|uniref:hypothetical protein n=1 Tax=Prosthecobacter sp. TaxID=1965333 RepID=UPI0037C79005
MSSSEKTEEMSGNSTISANLVNQAAAVANLALIMAQCERNAGLALLDDATSLLPTAQKLLERSASQLSIQPLSINSATVKQLYKFEELCADKTKPVRIAEDVMWSPFAEDGSKFRELLRACANASVKTQTEKWDGYVAKILCNIAIEPPTNPEEIDSNELEIDKVLQTKGNSFVEIRWHEVSELLKSARNDITERGRRNLEWAHRIINNWRQTLADHFYKLWLQEARDPGLRRDFVIWLAEQREQKNKTKGVRGKSPVAGPPE